jgi:hypothetical protein
LYIGFRIVPGNLQRRRRTAACAPEVDRAGGTHVAVDREAALTDGHPVTATAWRAQSAWLASGQWAADPNPGILATMRSHEWIDRRSLALHEAVAVKLEAHPELLDIARANLGRWLAVSTPPALTEWRDLLERAPLSDLLALLRAPGERATRLRQSSPFAGVLSPAERRSILAAHESRRA